jgi:hypothetical protein
VYFLIIRINSIVFIGPSIPDKAMFPQESIPQDFLDQLYECATMFKNFQVSSCVISNVHVYFFDEILLY